MNHQQSLWWEQTRSDHEVLQLLRKRGAAACHQLHYLQMVTEKLGKAYFWRSGHPPPKSHASFVPFLKALNDRPDKDRARIAEYLCFARPEDLDNWISSVLPLARELEQLAPQLAGDAPNPEYPWPFHSPTQAPVSYQFRIWTTLTDEGRGRQLWKRIDAAVIHFPKYC
jgi:hypothetical protein